MINQKLTVDHYGETPGEDRRITLSPGNIDFIAAMTEDSVVRGRPVRFVTILFSNGQNIELALNHQGLDLLEMAIGTFFME